MAVPGGRAVAVSVRRPELALVTAEVPARQRPKQARRRWGCGLARSTLPRRRNQGALKGSDSVPSHGAGHRPPSVVIGERGGRRVGGASAPGRRRTRGQGSLSPDRLVGANFPIRTGWRRRYRFGLRLSGPKDPARLRQLRPPESMPRPPSVAMAEGWGKGCPSNHKSNPKGGAGDRNNLISARGNRPWRSNYQGARQGAG